MSTLNGIQLLEVIGGVDDELVAESLAVFCPVAEGGTPVFMPIRKRPDRVLRAVMALGLAAALLCGVVTVVPFLGGPDLWQDFNGVIAPLLGFDETDTADERECDATEAEEEEPDEPSRPDQWDPSGGNWSGGAYGTGAEPEFPEVPTVRDPTPSLPSVNIPDPTPEHPTAPRPSSPTPGPGRWP